MSMTQTPLLTKEVCNDATTIDATYGVSSLMQMQILTRTELGWTSHPYLMESNWDSAMPL